ncbi:DUF485 domain-containing protein [Kitasatospora sp. NPDC050543]|uniref:DUF485 domain-containing protein n=1 Tax=Kitasatospora sp. NPDC050543 TaxID=3364054 RepID=UPI0037AFD23A
MRPQHPSSADQGERFDWWAGRPGRPGGPVPAARPAEDAAPAGPATTVVPGATSVPATPATTAVPAGPGAPAAPRPAGGSVTDSAQVYRAVQRSAAFQDIRRGYRAFVFPAAGVFLGWYLLYVGAQAAAPALMRHRVAGPVNVAWLLALLQFASTFLLTWLYARNARTRRDHAALELRWDTQDQLR